MDWVHAPPLTAAPRYKGGVRLTAARGRYGRSKTRRRNLLLNRALRAGSNGNPKTGKTVLAVTSRLGPAQ